jgi:hypothetical protein
VSIAFVVFQSLIKPTLASIVTQGMQLLTNFKSSTALIPVSMYHSAFAQPKALHFTGATVRLNAKICFHQQRSNAILISSSNSSAIIPDEREQEYTNPSTLFPTQPKPPSTPPYTPASHPPY